MFLLKSIVVSAFSLFRQRNARDAIYSQDNKSRCIVAAKKAFTADINSSSCDIDPIPTVSDNGIDKQSLHLLPEWEALSMENRIKLSKILCWEKISKWDFNVWEVNELTGGKPLLFLGWTLLASPHAERAMARSVGDNQHSLATAHGYHFLDKFNIHVEKLCAFMRYVEVNYQDVPYHNNLHAADVFQTTHALLQMGAKHYVDDIQIFSILLAAAGHDINHPGRNNIFQVNARTEYAIMYNNESCLEYMHASMLTDLISGKIWTPEIDIKSGFLPEEVRVIEHLVTESILHTNNIKHFDLVSEINEILANGSYDFETSTTLSTDDQEMFLVFLLHAADISNPTKPAPLFIDWANLILDEFFEQGDEEKSRNLPVSPLCDREEVNRENTQIGFMENIIYPTFKPLGVFVGKVKRDVLPIVNLNLEYWRAQSAKHG